MDGCKIDGWMSWLDGCVGKELCRERDGLSGGGCWAEQISWCLPRAIVGFSLIVSELKSEEEEEEESREKLSCFPLSIEFCFDDFVLI